MNVLKQVYLTEFQKRVLDAVPATRWGIDANKITRKVYPEWKSGTWGKRKAHVKRVLGLLRKYDLIKWYTRGFGMRRRRHIAFYVKDIPDDVRVGLKK
jgi:hypothetical protein